MENSMNKTLKHLDTWLSLNKLTINLNKTNYLIFNNNKAKLSIIINNIVIIQKISIKHLGDSNINWKLHTNIKDFPKERYNTYAKSCNSNLYTKYPGATYSGLLLGTMRCL